MNLPPGRSVQINIFSIPSHLPVVRGAIEKMCELLGFDGEAASGIVLSVDEALTNVIRHAYDNADDKAIEIELTPIGESQAEGLRIRIRDTGRVVDPQKIKSRDLKDIRPGGLGVHIIHECMDSVEYAPRQAGGTEMTMIKSVPTSS